MAIKHPTNNTNAVTEIDEEFMREADDEAMDEAVEQLLGEARKIQLAHAEKGCLLCQKALERERS